MTHLQITDAELSRAGALWTATEIDQQPAAWQATQAIVQRDAGTATALLAPLLARPELRIILTGAGSSAFIGQSLAPSLLQWLGRRVEAIATTDLLSGPRQYLQADVPTLLVSFGRSGSSPESVAVVELAERLVRECHQLVFTCNQAGTLYQRCRGRRNSLAVLLPPETHDQSFAMTSSFTSMMLAAWLVLSGQQADAQLVARIAHSARLLLDRYNEFFRRLAHRDFPRVVFLGSNGLQALAREAALKLLELTDGRVVASFDSPLGFRHGPKTIVNAQTLVVVFVSNDPYTRRYDLDLLRELRAEGQAGEVLAISATAVEPGAGAPGVLVEDLASAPDVELALPYIVCGQLYAFHRALQLGNTPDQPSASGTVTRVVRGVTIHPL